MKTIKGCASCKSACIIVGFNASFPVCDWVISLHLGLNPEMPDE